ncbi:MAG: DUF86 domain-containing protein [Salinisphaera sp.]|nr:DUF86 domain-containing protein [Salinisphaera sp.]MDN5939403.1 DUF86 domain-containing protein [Salinisphaera sp.]
MDPVILSEKLESLRNCVRRLEAKRAPSAVALHTDVDRQDIIALNLTRAVQLCVDIATHLLAATEEPVPATMGQAFEGLEHRGVIDPALCQRMQAAVGFRNIAVHRYEEIDWDIVHAITWRHLDDFRHFARAASAHITGDRDY